MYGEAWSVDCLKFSLIELICMFLLSSFGLQMVIEKHKRQHICNCEWEVFGFYISIVSFVLNRVSKHYTQSPNY